MLARNAQQPGHLLGALGPDGRGGSGRPAQVRAPVTSEPRVINQDAVGTELPSPARERAPKPARARRAGTSHLSLVIEFFWTAPRIARCALRAQQESRPGAQAPSRSAAGESQYEGRARSACGPPAPWVRQRQGKSDGCKLFRKVRTCGRRLRIAAPIPVGKPAGNIPRRASA